jgi:hypothetical protein
VPSTLQGIAVGSMAQPAMFNQSVFDTPTDGPNKGKKVFTMGLLFPNTTNAVIFEVVKPAAGFANGMSVNFDPSPTAAYMAASYLLGGLDQQAMTVKQLMYASNGSLTFSAIAEAPGSSINGTVTPTNYREIDQMTGADVAGGCTSALQGAQFFLKEKAAFAPSDAAQPEFQVMSPAQLAALRAQLDRLQAQ